MAALRTANVFDFPNLQQVEKNASASLFSTRLPEADEAGRSVFQAPKFLVVGHRGSGMNELNASDPRMNAIRENSIISFNAASKFPVDYVEFDVQVTSDGVPVIFHDDFIVAEENGMVSERRVTDLSLSEFRSYGHQREAGKVGKSLLRKTKGCGTTSWAWDVETDDSLCTLEEVFVNVVDPSLGFNIELKFDDHIEYEEGHLMRILQPIFKVVFEHAGDRPIIFSSFQPDAALLARRLQSRFPVFFLTDGGTEMYRDARRNSLEAAVKLCINGGLQGIVSECGAILRNPGAVKKIKESSLCLVTYGRLNNVPEAVYVQQLMGVEGVIVDSVESIADAVAKLMRPSTEGDGTRTRREGTMPRFSHTDLSFLMKLIPQLMQQ